ncbi:hypothetical protein FZC33_23285 [Labrys sp. KNU-23]|uniref:hypothetical protein n=1 Tax=Labrys sp. KNU-23 TaxID=2789216 RepID=UPI0011EE457F|nr:hypothetical protein [Labrys sp. KNU-23]QEN89045.1 hypothetical protein FZC33_23285 [Labrys sp. KNU-23]
MSDLHIRKLCNALIPNAMPSGLVPGVVVNTVDRMSRKAGGLWVGGHVEITPEGLSFAANGLNKAFHAGLQPVHIPMASIRKTWREFGWVTGIVAVGHDEGTFRFRCFGAGKVAAALEKHIAGRQER